MINRLQKKYALSVQGAKDLFKTIVYSVLANISLMLPVALLAIVLNTMLPMALGMEEKVAGFAGYTVVGIIILVIIFVLHYLQYTKAYIGTYEESERRRITLAEKLRTLPLGFFHERDLADLTSTIMGDCASFEQNGNCSFVGCTGGICNCSSFTQVAGTACKEIYDNKN